MIVWFIFGASLKEPFKVCVCSPPKVLLNLTGGHWTTVRVPSEKSSKHNMVTNHGYQRQGNKARGFDRLVFGANMF